jgi:hypothetical protein
MPDAAMAPYGLQFNPSGALMARVLGSSLTAFAVLLWLIRNETGAAANAVLWAGVVYNVIDIVTNLIHLSNGVLNAMGWIPTLLHVFLAAGMGYFATRR